MKIKRGRRAALALLAGAAAGGAAFWYVRAQRRRAQEETAEPPDDAGIRHEFRIVNGVRLHCARSGDEGPLVLFLHGFPEAWFGWRELLRDFGRDHRAVAPDLRGYNLSDRPPRVSDYRIEALVEDVRGLLDALSPGRKAVLVGHDWGGIVAWAFAAAHPEVLERLVIVNAPHPNRFAELIASDPRQMASSSYVLLFRSRLAEPLLRAFDCALLRRMVFGMSNRPEVFPPGLRALYRAAWTQPGALTGGLNYYRAVELAWPRPAVPPSALRVTAPTLVVWGERDPALRPENLAGLHAWVPDLKIVRLPDATHWVVHEEPGRVIEALRAFLTSPEAYPVSQGELL